MRHRVAALGMHGATHNRHGRRPHRGTTTGGNQVRAAAPGDGGQRSPRHHASASRSHHPFETGSAPIGHARLWLWTS
jgi:hypothetical protein